MKLNFTILLILTTSFLLLHGSQEPLDIKTTCKEWTNHRLVFLHQKFPLGTRFSINPETHQLTIQEPGLPKYPTNCELHAVNERPIAITSRENLTLVVFANHVQQAEQAEITEPSYNEPRTNNHWKPTYYNKAWGYEGNATYE